jgi:hypothetical protein
MPPIIVQDDSSLANVPNSSVELYSIESDANLSWENGSTKVFEGVVSASSPTTLTVSILYHVSLCDGPLIMSPGQVSTATLTIVEGDWTIDLILRPDLTKPLASSSWYFSSGGKISSIPMMHSASSLCE